MIERFGCFGRVHFLNYTDFFQQILTHRLPSDGNHRQACLRFDIGPYFSFYRAAACPVFVFVHFTRYCFFSSTKEVLRPDDGCPEHRKAMSEEKCNESHKIAEEEEEMVIELVRSQLSVSVKFKIWSQQLCNSSLQSPLCKHSRKCKVMSQTCIPLPSLLNLQKNACSATNREKLRPNSKEDSRNSNFSETVLTMVDERRIPMVHFGSVTNVGLLDFCLFVPLLD